MYFFQVVYILFFLLCNFILIWPIYYVILSNVIFNSIYELYNFYLFFYVSHGFVLQWKTVFYLQQKYKKNYVELRWL